MESIRAVSRGEMLTAPVVVAKVVKQLPRSRSKKERGGGPGSSHTIQDHEESTEIKGMNILVVEDEVDVATLIARYLGQYAYRVTIAANGQEALTKLRAHQYDLLIIDMLIPIMDGRALYTHLEKMDPALAQCTIFMTGDPANRVVRDFLDRVGWERCLSKPFSLNELYAMVKAVQEKKRGARGDR